MYYQQFGQNLEYMHIFACYNLCLSRNSGSLRVLDHLMQTVVPMPFRGCQI